MRRRIGLAVVVLGLAIAVVGCKSGIEDDPILVLSSAEALAEGKRLMGEEKYQQARDYLTHAFEVEPNSAGGREALLLVADAHFLQDREDGYIRAEAKYRDFQTRFPTSQKAAYVQYQIADSLMRRLEKPDRDQTATFDAMTEFHSVIELYPTSQFAPLAQEKIVEVRQHLAKHELAIGYFYFRSRNFNGAKLRLEYLLENYPEFESTDRVLYLLGMAFYKIEQTEESETAFDRLRNEFPDSEFINKIPKS